MASKRWTSGGAVAVVKGWGRTHEIVKLRVLHGEEHNIPMIGKASDEKPVEKQIAREFH